MKESPEVFTAMVPSEPGLYWLLKDEGDGDGEETIGLLVQDADGDFRCRFDEVCWSIPALLLSGYLFGPRVMNSAETVEFLKWKEESK